MRHHSRVVLYVGVLSMLRVATPAAAQAPLPPAKQQAAPRALDRPAAVPVVPMIPREVEVRRMLQLHEQIRLRAQRAVAQPAVPGTARIRVSGNIGGMMFILVEPESQPEKPDAEREEDEHTEEEQPARPPVILRGHKLVVARETFDEWVYSGQTAIGYRRALNDLLVMRIKSAERSNPLTEMKKQKLRLAGQGDIKRYFDQVEEKRKEFEIVSNRHQTMPAVRARSPAPYPGREKRAVRRRSLFAKTLRKMLADQTRR